MVKSYFLAPNFTTAPPPEGPIKLGSILRNISEFETLNRTVQAIPVMQLHPVNKQTGFEIFLGQLHSADFGLTAKVLGLLGLGTSASIERTKGSNNLLSCQRLDTFTFDPTESYINESMKDLDVRSFMRSSRFRLPVYMVTGLKVARGASSTSSTSRLVAIGSDTSLVPPGVPVPVRKIWLDRKEEVQHKAYIKKAVMQDGTPSSRELSFTVRSDDDLTPEEVDEMFGKTEDDI
ncbi:hypothetical protein EDB80DRAFT_561675 [Ilyonectria destructans]|nr:hypothetical protein EDB80DRAFT_561675 [Ilyonectria destructans]